MRTQTWLPRWAPTGGATRTPLISGPQQQSGLGSSNWVELSTRMEDAWLLFPNHSGVPGNLPPPLGGAVNTPPVTGPSGHHGSRGAQDCSVYAGYRRGRGQDHNRERSDVIGHGRGRQHRQAVRWVDADRHRKGEHERHLEYRDEQLGERLAQHYCEGDGRSRQHQFGVIAVKCEGGCGDLAALIPVVANAADADAAPSWREPPGERIVRSLIPGRGPLGRNSVRYRAGRR